MRKNERASSTSHVARDLNEDDEDDDDDKDGGGICAHTNGRF